MTWLGRLAWITAVLTFVQIVLGAAVRLTNSGLSCPDWPLCYGLWFPTPAKLAALDGVGYTFGQVMFEWVHRFNAAVLVGPLTVIVVILAWRVRDRVPAMAWLAPASLVVLLIQGGLGGFTVLDSNSPWSVAVHLTVALLFLALIMMMAMAAAQRHGEDLTAGGQGRLWLAIFATTAAVASGAMMAKSGASLACASWPLCNETFWPDLSDELVRVHVIHRLLAVLAVLLVVWAYFGARAASSPAARAASHVAVAVIVIQILFGALVTFTFHGDSLTWQVAIGAVHQGVGVLVFAALVVALWRGRGRALAPRPVESPVSP